ncbi:MAG: Rrf2 family transcriptional regulator, partial [Oscillospiraceae bacterium]
YRLAHAPGEFSALDVLEAVELSLFEEVQETVGGKAPDIELALQRCVFESLDTAARGALGAATIERIVAEAERSRQNNEIMFYI